MFFLAEMAKILENRALRAPKDGHNQSQNRESAAVAKEKVEHHAKTTHSISDFWAATLS